MRFPWQKKNNDHEFPITAAASNGETRVLSIEPELTALSCDIIAISETGPTRQSNEDNIVYFYPESGTSAVFAMVADGMGGHNAGEVASAMACEVAKDFIPRQFQVADIPSMLGIFIQRMHLHIREASQKDPAYEGMGTTAVSALVKDNTLFFAHIGDSRLYQYRDHQLTQLTHDHTLVNQMVKEGKITQAEAATHDMRNVLMQALGTVAIVAPEVSAEGITLHDGDKYFLCSDGVYDVLRNEELAEILAIQNPAFAIEVLNSICTTRKATDNFSAIILSVNPPQKISYNPETKEQTIFV